jgi:hypothetical protein
VLLFFIFSTCSIICLTSLHRLMRSHPKRDASAPAGAPGPSARRSLESSYPRESLSLPSSHSEHQLAPSAQSQAQHAPHPLSQSADLAATLPSRHRSSAGPSAGSTAAASDPADRAAPVPLHPGSASAAGAGAQPASFSTWASLSQQSPSSRAKRPATAGGAGWRAGEAAVIPVGAGAGGAAGELNLRAAIDGLVSNAAALGTLCLPFCFPVPALGLMLVSSSDCFA